MNVQSYNINLRVGTGITQNVKISQGDVGRELVFYLYDGAVRFSPPSGATVKIKGTKPSGLGFNVTCTLSGSVARVFTTLAMTQEGGNIPAELEITNGNTVIGTANFMIYAEPSPHPAGTTDGTTEEARTVLEQCEEYAQAAQDAADSATEDYTEVRSDVDDLKTNLLSKYNKNVLYANNLELGYYSKVNGSKQDNSSSTNYSRTKSLIPADEDTLYVGNVTAIVTCYDKDRNYIGNITIYNRTYKVPRQTTPSGTAYVGLTATNPQYFQLEKVDSGGVQSIEYPYESDSYLHIESCWCNGSGTIASTANLDMLIIQVNAGERWYVSNSSSYNLLCFDRSGVPLESTYETRSPIGKIVTVPANAKTMCVNLYRNRTKGTSSDMSDYVARLGSKKVLAIGDSITWLDGRQNYGGAEYFSGWQRQLRLAGYDVINAGWSGYPYANGIDIVDGVSYSIYKEIVTKEYDVSGYDFVILFGGTNDVLYNGALGDRPTDYSNRTFDDTKFNGAIGGIVDYIRQNNNNAKIIMASFPKSEAVSRSFANALSRIEEIKYNSLFWSCAYVDIFSELNIQPTYDAFDVNFYDATHPNFLGMQKIGVLILNAVKKYCD